MTLQLPVSAAVIDAAISNADFHDALAGVFTAIDPDNQHFLGDEAGLHVEDHTEEQWRDAQPDWRRAELDALLVCMFGSATNGAIK